MLYGLLSRSAVSFNPSTDIPDLGGKVILITGGTSSSCCPSYIRHPLTSLHSRKCRIRSRICPPALLPQPFEDLSRMPERNQSPCSNRNDPRPDPDCEARIPPTRPHIISFHRSMHQRFSGEGEGAGYPDVECRHNGHPSSNN